MSKYSERPLGDVVHLDVDEVSVCSSSTYEIAGVYSFGRGLFSRGPIQGNETSYKKLNRLHEGDIVLSRLKAFEGAISIINKQFDGFFLSPEFPTFSASADTDRRYLDFLCRWPEFWKSLSKGSKGLGARRERVSANRLLEIEVPLPDLVEQARIADKLSVIFHKAAAAVAARDSQIDLAEKTMDSAIQSVFDNAILNGWELCPLSEVANINPRTEQPDVGTRVAFVPMAALNAIIGSVEVAEYKEVSSIGAGYKRFHRGDVIFARITPCMQNGKSAIFNDNYADFGYGSSEFHVVRPIRTDLSEWIYRYMRSKEFRNRAIPSMTGTAGQQRVPVSYLRDATIPIPPDAAELQTAINYLRNMENKRLQLRCHQLKQAETLKALRTSILNAAFTGRL